jgi:hypothetical protein
MHKEDTLAGLIELPMGLEFTFSDGFAGKAPIIVLGNKGEMAFNADSLPTVMSIGLQLGDMKMAYGNIQAANLTGLLQVTGTRSNLSLEGNYEFWGVKNSATLQVDSKMELRLSGFVFQGIYLVELLLSSPIAVFQDSVWTVSFSISAADIASLSSKVSDILENWVQDGLDTLKLASKNADALSLTMVSNQKKQCSEKCPTVETCVSPLYLGCSEKMQYWQCLENSPVCDSSIECKDSDSICTDRTCKNKVEVCSEYSSQCEYGDALTCTSYELIDIGIECLEFSFMCELEQKADQFCSSRCDYADYVYSSSKDEYEIAQAMNEAAVTTELGGFADIEGETLFTIVKVYAAVDVGEAGMSGSDFLVNVEFNYFAQDELKPAQAKIVWDYDNDAANARTLSQIIIKKIVKNTEKLSTKLSTKTPFEVYSEL